MKDILLKILRTILLAASPELREMVVEWVNLFEAKAKQTDNPWDDVLASILKAILTPADE